MICPHCHKAIQHTVSEEALALAKEYQKQGFSLREIEKLLFKDGHKASAASLSRKLKAVKK